MRETQRPQSPQCLVRGDDVWTLQPAQYRSDSCSVAGIPSPLVVPPELVGGVTGTVGLDDALHFPSSVDLALFFVPHSSPFPPVTVSVRQDASGGLVDCFSAIGCLIFACHLS